MAEETGLYERRRRKFRWVFALIWAGSVLMWASAGDVFGLYDTRSFLLGAGIASVFGGIGLHFWAEADERERAELLGGRS